MFRTRVGDAVRAASGRRGGYASVGAQKMRSLADQPVFGPGRDSSVAALVEQLYRSHAGLVRSVCRSVLRDWVEAEDAAQQTFLSAQRALINGSVPQDAAAWLATIARNESLGRVRARMREPLAVELGEHGAAPDVHAAASRRYEASELCDAIAQLPLQQREAFLLREVQGLSSQEVAAAMSLTPPAAESLAFRARRRLRRQLQGAFAGLSLGLWLQPIRKLAASATSSGLAGPAAAKVAAVGVGTALVAGGAFVGPTVIHRFDPGLRHLSSTPRLTAPASHPQASASPVTFSLSRAPRPVRAATIHHLSADRTNGDPAPPQHSGEQSTSGAGQSQAPTDATANGNGSVPQSSSDSADNHSPQQDNSPQQDTSSSTDSSQTGSTDGGSTDSSSTSTGGGSTDSASSSAGGDSTPGD